MEEYKPYRLFLMLLVSDESQCLPAILKLAIIHLQWDPFQTCTSYTNPGVTNAVQKSSRCPKNHCLSCADELSLYLHRCASSSACTDEGKVFQRIYIKNIFIICFSCQLSAKGSVHSIHHWDTILEIKSSFILSLELVPWQFIVKMIIKYSSCSSLFSLQSSPLGHRAKVIHKIQVL